MPRVSAARGCRISTGPGPSLRGAGQCSRPSPFAFLRRCGHSAKPQRRGPAPELAQPRPSRSLRFPGGPRPPWGPTETGFLHLPLLLAGELSGSKWPRLGGMQTAAGVRYGPSQLPYARKGDRGWICNSQPTNSRKGRSHRGLMSSLESKRRGASLESERKS